MQSFEVYEQVREHVQVADHDSRTCEEYFHGKGNMFKQSDSDSHGEDGWVSWDSWIGWDEAEDLWRMGRPDCSTDRRKKESKGGSTEESGSGSEEIIPGNAKEPAGTNKWARLC